MLLGAFVAILAILAILYIVGRTSYNILSFCCKSCNKKNVKSNIIFYIFSFLSWEHNSRYLTNKA